MTEAEKNKIEQIFSTLPKTHYIEKQKDIEPFIEQLVEKFKDVKGRKIEYLYAPNQKCSDRGFEWTQTFHRITISVEEDERIIYWFEIQIEMPEQDFSIKKTY